MLPLKKTAGVLESFKLLAAVEKGMEVVGNCGYNLRRCFEGFIMKGILDATKRTPYSLRQ